MARCMLNVRGAVRRGGTAIVELAVSLPLLLSVMIGIINGGHIMFVRQVVMSASREGAHMFTKPTSDAVLARRTAEKFLTKYFNSTSVPTCVQGNTGEVQVQAVTLTSVPPGGVIRPANDLRRVTVTVPVADVLLAGNYLNLWSPTRLLTGQTIFRAEQ